MTVWVLVAVMAAAFMHATWNALIKLGTSKLTSMLILTVVQGGFGLIIALTRPMPDPHVWLWLLASGVFHSAYKLFLAYAYEQGDLSRVYPIARGTAPMVVLVISALFLADKIAGWEYVGIIILGLGILLMARGVFSSGESRKLLPFALGSAMATAGYSIVDGLGAREAGMLWPMSAGFLHSMRCSLRRVVWPCVDGQFCKPTVRRGSWEALQLCSAMAPMQSRFGR